MCRRVSSAVVRPRRSATAGRRSRRRQARPRLGEVEEEDVVGGVEARRDATSALADLVELGAEQAERGDQQELRALPQPDQPPRAVEREAEQAPAGGWPGRRPAGPARRASPPPRLARRELGRPGPASGRPAAGSSGSPRAGGSGRRASAACRGRSRRPRDGRSGEEGGQPVLGDRRQRSGRGSAPVSSAADAAPNACGRGRDRRGSARSSCHRSRSMSVVTLCGSPRSTVCSSSRLARSPSSRRARVSMREAGNGVPEDPPASPGTCRCPADCSTRSSRSSAVASLGRSAGARSRPRPGRSRVTAASADEGRASAWSGTCDRTARHPDRPADEAERRARDRMANRGSSARCADDRRRPRLHHAERREDQPTADRMPRRGGGVDERPQTGDLRSALGPASGSAGGRPARGRRPRTRSAGSAASPIGVIGRVRPWASDMQKNTRVAVAGRLGRAADRGW